MKIFLQICLMIWSLTFITHAGDFIFVKDTVYYINNDICPFDTNFVTVIQNRDKAHNTEYHWDSAIVVTKQLLKVVRGIGKPIYDTRYSTNKIELINKDGKTIYSAPYGPGGEPIEPLQEHWGVMVSIYEGRMEGICLVYNDKMPISYFFHNDIANTYGGKSSYSSDHYVVNWKNSIADYDGEDIDYQLHIYDNGKMQLLKNNEEINCDGLIIKFKKRR